ncbi:hypothetical protein IU459_15755 [Nocardia amamiensis]|uniref:Uncharacterized protein n=1 Tax=Nocardia amamiensis TaxID=404578 RepID=A0ABS0CQT8_9NOCA|nr:hypothetical protein [Nocardia amamiensis]MBF6298988.1 hypothetical protein [Nocardia amamiensis]
MAQSISWAQIVLSTVSGATAGGVVNILAGSTKAEREERGKRRIDARADVGKSLRTFRHEYRRARLQRLENQTVEVDQVFKAALQLASATNTAMRALSAIERLRLRRGVASVIGAETIGLANLQPDGAEEIDGAALHMAAEKYRRDPQVSIRQLIELDPTEPSWDLRSNRIERLARKYP